MVVLAHGVHMLARSSSPPHKLADLSVQVLRMTGVPPIADYQVGDFERLGRAALPDPLARMKLESLSELVWRAAAFQSDPELKLALIEMVKGFSNEPAPGA